MGLDRGTVLGKAVTVLQAFTADDGLVTLAELTRRTGLAKGTLHRVANDLVEVAAARHPYQRAYLPVNRKPDGSVFDW